MISKVASNVLKCNFPIPESDKKKLTKHRSIIRKLERKSLLHFEKEVYHKSKRRIPTSVINSSVNKNWTNCCKQTSKINEVSKMISVPENQFGSRKDLTSTTNVIKYTPDQENFLQQKGNLLSDIESILESNFPVGFKIRLHNQLL